MGRDDPGSGRLSESRRLEIETRLRDLTDDLARFQRLSEELKRAGESTAAAEGIMRLLVDEQEVLIKELGYNPKSN